MLCTALNKIKYGCDGNWTRSASSLALARLSLCSVNLVLSLCSNTSDLLIHLPSYFTSPLLIFGHVLLRSTLRFASTAIQSKGTAVDNDCTPSLGPCCLLLLYYCSTYYKAVAGCRLGGYGGKCSAGGMSEDNDRCFSTLVLGAFSTGVFQHHCITPH